MRPLWLTALLWLLPATGFAGLQVSPNQRHLVDDQGHPFFVVGDAAWSLIAELDLQGAETYLQDRADRGFNLVMVNLIEHAYGTNAPANIYDEAPFTGAPFVTPNEAYFAHADAVIQLAAQRGIVVLLAPLYLGYECNESGWCAEVQNASLADMTAWGRYVGQRYANVEGLIWLVGGDTDPTPVADEVRAMVAGIREFDAAHLITAHNQAETQAITPWPAEPWLDVNNVYTHSSTLYVQMKQAYEVDPPRPVFLLEADYENEHSSTPGALRAQSHWAALSGGFGHVFGNCPIWHFGYYDAWCGLVDWQDQLDGIGSVQMTAFGNLYRSRHWTELVPDFDHAVLTSGYGTWGGTDYAAAAWAADGSSILVYVPTPRTITIDASVLEGDTVRAWWYDPLLGSAEPAGTFPKGILTFSARFPDDWVLVLDDDGLGLPAPGVVPTATEPSPPVAKLRIEQNRPNPFNPRTTVEYVLPARSRVTVTIYDAAGRRVRVLLDAEREPGSHQVTWDGIDDHGRAMASGVYQCEVRTPEATASRKLVLLR